MSTADRLRQEGRQEARQEAQRRSQRRLLRQLELRFGEIPANVRERVDAADDEQLDLWAERILTAATIDEVV